MGAVMAHGLEWFQLYTEDYLIGTEGLTWEEQGVYVRLLVLMYDRNGPLPDDDRVISRMLLGDIRAWRRVKETLISLGKIKMTSAGLINERVMGEIKARQDKSRKASKSAQKRWKGRTEIGGTSGVAIAELSDSYPIANEQLTGDRSEKPNEINGTPVKTTAML